MEFSALSPVPEAHRKIVIGGAVLRIADDVPGFAAWLRQRLPELLAERDQQLVEGVGQRPKSPG